MRWTELILIFSKSFRSNRALPHLNFRDARLVSCTMPGQTYHPHQHNGHTLSRRCWCEAVLKSICGTPSRIVCGAIRERLVQSPQCRTSVSGHSIHFVWSRPTTNGTAPASALIVVRIIHVLFVLYQFDYDNPERMSAKTLGQLIPSSFIVFVFLPGFGLGSIVPKSIALLIASFSASPMINRFSLLFSGSKFLQFVVC